MSGSAELKIALACSIAEGAKATSGMGRLTLYQAVSLVVILHLMTHFSIEDSPLKGYISGSADIYIFSSQRRRFSDVLAICGAPTGTESKIARLSTAMFSTVAAKACVALWTVLERCLIRIRIRPLDKSQRFLYLLDRQWLTLESRITI